MSGQLAHLRVVEASTSLAAASCAKLLADLGADVVKFEPAGGDPWRRVTPQVDLGGVPVGVPFLYANTGKRSYAVPDGAGWAHPQLAAMLRDADLLVTDVLPADLTVTGLLDAARVAANPALVTVCLTRFGGDGPRARLKAAPLNTFHAAGEGAMTPLVSDFLPDGLSRPPLRQGRFLGEHKVAGYAAAVALAAVRHAAASGQGQVVDMSAHEALVGLNFFEFSDWLVGRGPVPSRSSRQLPFGGVMRCADGYVQLTIHEDHHWAGLVEMIGSPPWTSEDWAVRREGRAENGRHA